MNFVYAGVGSRKAPDDILDRMKAIAQFLAGKGWTLRSGGANGPDTAFEFAHDSMGVVRVRGTEIFLPWQGFNGRSSKYASVSKEAMELASQYIPHWQMLNWAAKLLHGRNAYQVMGWDLKTPAAMVVCWTPGGKIQGGTATAIKIAEGHGIPVYNLARLPDDEWLTRLQPNGFCAL